MKYRTLFRDFLAISIVGLCILATGEISSTAARLTGIFTPDAVEDQNSVTPLVNPVPSNFAPRYLSGFGIDDSFTVFFEDRDLGGQISFIQTTSGVDGFPASPTPTNITDTHFVVKNWPYPDTGVIQYQYRGWGAEGNNPNHNFYGSNDLETWFPIAANFTIPNDPGFTNARGFVYYGFHDVIRIPQASGLNPYHYYAWGESNQGQTMLVYSTDGGSNWTTIASVGGTDLTDGPLIYPESCTPSGNFFDLGHDRGYGKIQARGNDSGIYLAVNSEAKASLSPGDFEAAFINPDNWTWHDGTNGLMSTPLLTATTEHDYREVWLVPSSGPDFPWEGIYNADFGQVDGGNSLGHFLINPEEFVPPPADPESLPATGFPRGKTQKVFVEESKQKIAGNSDLMLQIPRLGVKMPIVGVPLMDGNWDVTWLGDNAGYLYGTAFPTWQGNTAITGHVWGADNLPGPFHKLKTLRFGDQIQIQAWGLIYTYEVRENGVTLPNKVKNTLVHEEYDWVTLLTCEFYNPFNGNYIFRRVVRAVLVEISSQ